MVYSLSCSILWLWSLIAMVTFQTGDAWYTYVDRVERAMPEADPGVRLTHNETSISNETDNHQYYTVDYRDHDPALWMDVETLGTHLEINERLSNSERHAVRVGLSFSFPFYGYSTSFLHITSSGFLYVGSYPHRLLAETQYVAPLMADFTPKVDSRSTVSYFKNGSMFVAEWKNVHLNSDHDKNFTFQAVIYKNGTILFSYKELQLPVNEISSDNPSKHPVKVGLADAYYVDTWFGIFTRRVIYEYHSVVVDFERVQPLSSIILTPLETCTARTTCSSCTTNPPDGFNCTWCGLLQKCSDGFDRHRQTWVRAGCDKRNRTTCPAPPPTQAPPEDICPTLHCGPGTCKDNKCVCPDGYFGAVCQGTENNVTPSNQKGNSSKAGLVVFFLILVLTVVVIASWVFYAYRNPTTESGLTLIRITRCYYCKASKEAGGTYKYSRTADNI